MPRTGGGGVRSVRRHQDAVQLAGRDAPAALGPDVDRGLEHATHALAGLGADRHDRREVEERHLVADPLDVLVEGLVGLLGHEVPLVDRDDQALALLDRVARDVGVLRRQPLDGIDDEDRDIGARQRAQRPQRRVALGGGAGRDLAAPPDAGGIDEDDLAAAPGQARIDGVAGRPGRLRDDRAFLARAAH